MSPFEVICDVSTAFGISERDLMGMRRNRRLSQARIAAARRLRDDGLSYSDIGRALGGRDHTTVQYLLGIRRRPKAHSPVLEQLLGGMGTDECE